MNVFATVKSVSDAEIYSVSGQMLTRFPIIITV